MNTETRKKLQTAGIDAESAIQRFMGNEALYEKFALQFLEDPTYDTLLDAIANREVQEAFAAAHTLKGISGNLSFSNLYVLRGMMTELLRKEELGAAKEYIPELERVYQTVQNALEEWKE